MSSASTTKTSVEALHERVDERTEQLARRHAQRLKCRLGCSDCCVDDLTVFEVEAARIRRDYPEVLHEPPHPLGACAFLDTEGGCRVYEARPYVCRTQGLPLRWFETEGEQVYEIRDICPLNEAGEPLEELDADACWLIGPVEGELAALQAGPGRAWARVALRSLFVRS